MSPLRKPLFITNGCKIQYLRHLKKSFLNVAILRLYAQQPWLRLWNILTSSSILNFSLIFMQKRVFGVDSWMYYSKYNNIKAIVKEKELELIPLGKVDELYTSLFV